jgi:hypothetical protein
MVRPTGLREIFCTDSLPRNRTEGGRIELRLRSRLQNGRAAALKRQDLTGYILGTVLPHAESETPKPNGLR